MLTISRRRNVVKSVPKNSEGEIKTNQIIEGTILGKSPGVVYLDLGEKTGIIYGREFLTNKENLKSLKAGDKVFVRVMDLENENGYAEVSLNRAKKALNWKDLEKKKADNETVVAKVVGINKGGLVVELAGLRGFLPFSQVSEKYYSHIENEENPDMIKKLEYLLEKEIEAKILDFSIENEKLILSQKILEAEEKTEALKQFKIGDVVEGEVSGIVHFGVFFKFNNGIEGLIHISEISEQPIKDITEVLKIGQKIKAKIIEIVKDKIYFSLKGVEK